MDVARPSNTSSSARFLHLTHLTDMAAFSNLFPSSLNLQPWLPPTNGPQLPLELPETKNDEDEYIAGLAERLAHAMLDDLDSDGAFGQRNEDLCASTLPTGSSLGSSSSSNPGSPEACSPQFTPLGVQDATWDNISAAAGEASRFQMLAEARNCSSLRPSPAVNQPQGYSSCHQQGFLAADNSFSPPPAFTWDRTCPHMHAHEADDRISTCQPGAFEPGLDSNWVPHVKPVQMSHISMTCRSGLNTESAQQFQSLCNVPSQSPVAKPAAGSGMRAIFLGPKGSGHEPSGTGVFLPRRAGNGVDSKKKSSCSTVLLPMRVVQALNLNVEKMQPFAIGPSGALLFRPMMHTENRYMPSSPSMSENLPRVFFQPASKIDLVDCERRHGYPIHSLQSSQVDLEASLPTEWIY